MPISAKGLDFDDAAQEERFEGLVGPPGKWRETRNFQLDVLDRLGLAPSHKLLDIGCGSLRAGAALIRYLDTQGYAGVDVSSERIEAAEQVVARFGLGDKKPRLLACSDFGSGSLAPASFDFIWCYQVVIHLEEALVRAFMAAASRLLKPGGCAWLSARVREGDDGFHVVGSWREFPVTEAGTGYYRNLAAGAGLGFADLGSLAEWGLPASRQGASNHMIELRKPADEIAWRASRTENTVP